MSFERKQKLREDIKKTRELSRTLINEKNAENEARKERRRENIKRRSENQKKSEIVQVVMHFFLKTVWETTGFEIIVSIITLSDFQSLTVLFMIYDFEDICLSYSWSN